MDSQCFVAFDVVSLYIFSILLVVFGALNRSSMGGLILFLISVSREQSGLKNVCGDPNNIVGWQI